MKTIYRYITYVILILITVSINAYEFVNADITFENWSWSTTFDYWPCTQRGGGGDVDCDNIQNDGTTWSWGAKPIYDNYTVAIPDANNPTITSVLFSSALM